MLVEHSGGAAAERAENVDPVILARPRFAAALWRGLTKTSCASSDAPEAQARVGRADRLFALVEVLKGFRRVLPSPDLVQRYRAGHAARHLLRERRKPAGQFASIGPESEKWPTGFLASHKLGVGLKAGARQIDAGLAESGCLLADNRSDRAQRRLHGGGGLRRASGLGIAPGRRR